MNVTNARNCLFICEINWQKEKRARKRTFTGLSVFIEPNTKTCHGRCLHKKEYCLTLCFAYNSISNSQILVDH